MKQDKVKTAGDLPGCRSCHKVMSTPSNCLRGPHTDFLSGFTPLAFDQPRPPCKATGDLWGRGRLYSEQVLTTCHYSLLHRHKSFPVLAKPENLDSCEYVCDTGYLLS